MLATNLFQSFADHDRDQQLILFVSLDINKNTAPVRTLGKMMLQNLQLVVGKRYESESERRRRDKPLFSLS
jgi:hypothetical protein